MLLQSYKITNYLRLDLASSTKSELNQTNDLTLDLIMVSFVTACLFHNPLHLKTEITIIMIT